MKLKIILATLTILCALVGTAVSQSSTASPTPSPSPTETPAQASPSPTPSSETPQARPKPTKLRVSQGVAEGNLIHKVQPKYPEEARAQHLQGDVVFKMLISRTGEVEYLELFSGDLILAKAAMDAIKQWKYRPYLLNGEPMEVESQVKVSFHLHR